MELAMFSIAIEDDRMILRGHLDDSDEVKARLTVAFTALKEEAEANRVAGTADDPEYAEWQERQKGKEPGPGEDVHINYLAGPAYKSLTIDAADVQLGVGGLDLWLKLTAEILYPVALRYEQSVLAEILQHLGDSHYHHPRTTFLCQNETLLDKERLHQKAKAQIELYHMVVRKEGDKWVGSGLEIYGALGSGDSIEECVTTIIRGQIVLVHLMLERGQVPPPPMKDWRKRLKKWKDETEEQ